MIADFGTTGFGICGRYNHKSSGGDYPWLTDNLPLFTHWDGSYWEGKYDMGAGDVLEVMLIYDPDTTLKLGSYTTNYTARVITKVS